MYWSRVDATDMDPIQSNADLKRGFLLCTRNHEGKTCLTLVNDASTRGLVLVLPRPASLGIMGCGGMCCHMRHITS